MASVGALSLPRLAMANYRLHPIVDQIADKVCATMYLHDNRASSREKDLVDLVVVALTQDVDGSLLGAAIGNEVQRRKMSPFKCFVIPSGWGTAYSRLAQKIPYCQGVEHIDTARDLVASFINPALDGSAVERMWKSDARRWTN